MSDHSGFVPDVSIRCNEFKIGAIGSGFIMADVHLAAYDKAGFPVVAIASRHVENAESVANKWNIPKVHQTPEKLIEDPKVEILDMAYPPHLQLDLVRHALKQPHIKAILCQKPLALNLQDSQQIVRECEAAGKVLSVNQNMRFDQSMRVLKQILDKGELGEPVIATIEMRAIPHWQTFLQEYDRLTLLNMSVHHLDILRYLFGNPTQIYTAVRKDPRTLFEHRDGICASTLQFPSGLIAVSLEDVWAGPSKEGFESDIYIKWRVEGTDGLAQGTIGWPDYPIGSPSTLRYCAPTTDGQWKTPTWDTRWFPHAFTGVMEQLQYALKKDELPNLNGKDNLGTMALVEAGYCSMKENRPVLLKEFGL
jgi:predicted dehydrogenase